MSYPHSCVLLVGATSGIGLAMAERFIAAGSKVIAVGRRRDRLDAFVDKHGSAKAGSIPFDIVNSAGVPQFVEEATSRYPEIDCVYLNAGRSRGYNFAKPNEVNLDSFRGDIELNFLSFVDLTKAFLPFLMAKDSPTSITYTGTLISVVPGIGISSYSASKAALNAFIMCIRAELAQAESSVKIVEIFAPPVQTELHDILMGPDKGRAFGMPADEFAERTYAKLITGTEQVIIGTIGEEKTYMSLIDTRMGLFEGLCGLMRTSVH